MFYISLGLDRPGMDDFPGYVGSKQTAGRVKVYFVLDSLTRLALQVRKFPRLIDGVLRSHGYIV